MAQTIAALFDTSMQAQQAVQDLINNGVSRANISVITQHYDDAQATATTPSDASADAAGAGAIGGTVLGGVLGMLVGIGALAIPGIGPIIAAGPLAAAIGTGTAAVGMAAAGAGIGAATGGLLGALAGAGIPEEEAHYYAEGVRRGGTLVTVASDTIPANTTMNILQRNGAVDIKGRANEWQQQGWQRFDPNATPYQNNSNDAAWERSSKAGTATGTIAGAAVGATVGSVGGPVGTVVGGITGAAAGSMAGAAGDVVGEKTEDRLEDQPVNR